MSDLRRDSRRTKDGRGLGLKGSARIELPIDLKTYMKNDFAPVTGDKLRYRLMADAERRKSQSWFNDLLHNPILMTAGRSGNKLTTNVISLIRIVAKDEYRDIATITNKIAGHQVIKDPENTVDKYMLPVLKKFEQTNSDMDQYMSGNYDGWQKSFYDIGQETSTVLATILGGEYSFAVAGSLAASEAMRNAEKKGLSKKKQLLAGMIDGGIAAVLEGGFKLLKPLGKSLKGVGGGTLAKASEYSSKFLGKAGEYCGGFFGHVGEFCSKAIGGVSEFGGEALGSARQAIIKKLGINLGDETLSQYLRRYVRVMGQRSSRATERAAEEVALNFGKKEAWGSIVKYSRNAVISSFFSLAEKGQKFMKNAHYARKDFVSNLTEGGRNLGKYAGNMGRRSFNVMVKNGKIFGNYTRNTVHGIDENIKDFQAQRKLLEQLTKGGAKEFIQNFGKEEAWKPLQKIALFGGMKFLVDGMVGVGKGLIKNAGKKLYDKDRSWFGKNGVFDDQGGIKNFIVGGGKGHLKSFLPKYIKSLLPKLVKSLIPKYAFGTSYHPGGLALVGEQGPELLNLPAGAQVVPNHRTERLLHGSMGKPGMAVTYAPQYNIQGNADREVLEQVSRSAYSEFERNMQSFLERRRRLSFAGA